MSNENSQPSTAEELIANMKPPGARDLPQRVRRAIVTGGTTGIGRYTALALAADGCDLAITYAHDPDEANATAAAIRQLGRNASVHKFDADYPEHAAPVIDQMVDQLGGLDIFVNNAGMMVQETLTNMTLESLTKLFRINVFGAAMAMQRAARHMLDFTTEPADESFLESALHTARWLIDGREVSPRPTPGRIIVITSVHERVASPVDTPYTMSKHALGGLVKCAALELTRYNITVNAVAPGEIATPMNDMDAEDYSGTTRPAVPAGRAGHPTEIAEAVRFLAADESSFITGCSYPVDGGFEIMTPLAHSGYRAMAK